uniref:Uncharacterized protein n=1 Tax=Schistocephalus solidus TaxID=70667 RepID=A0A0V0J8W7_SCHSO
MLIDSKVGVFGSPEIQFCPDYNMFSKKGVHHSAVVGTGKTTLVSRLAKVLKERATVLGFITEEVRDIGTGRLGFDIVQLYDNKRGSLARLQTFFRSPGDFGYLPRVGRYYVTVSEFEKIAIPCLEVSCNCHVNYNR